MCFVDGEFLTGAGDVLVGDIDGCPMYVDQRQLAAWPHRDLVLDVQPGYADGMSLDAGDGLHFVTRYDPATGTPVSPLTPGTSGASVASTHE
jgi:uncharacterized protein (DUF779 family)